MQYHILLLYIHRVPLFIHQDIPEHLIYTCVEEDATFEITDPTLHHTLSMVARTVTVIPL